MFGISGIGEAFCLASSNIFRLRPILRRFRGGFIVIHGCRIYKRSNSSLRTKRGIIHSADIESTGNLRTRSVLSQFLDNVSTQRVIDLKLASFETPLTRDLGCLRQNRARILDRFVIERVPTRLTDIAYLARLTGCIGKGHGFVSFQSQRRGRITRRQGQA